MKTSLDEIFRFVLMRPPVTQTDTKPVDVKQDTPVQNAISESTGVVDDRKAAQAVVEKAVADGDIVSEKTPLTLTPQILRALAAMDAAPPKTNDELVKTIETAFGTGAEVVAASKDFKSDRKRLADTLVAAKVFPDIVPASPDLVRAMRLFVAIERAAELIGKKTLDRNGKDLVKVAASVHITFPFVEKRLQKKAADSPAAKAPAEDPDAVEAERSEKGVEEVVSADRRGDVVVNTASAVQPAKSARFDGIVQKGLRWLGVAKKANSISSPPLEVEAKPSLALTEKAVAALSPETKGVLAKLNLDPLKVPAPILANALHENAIAKIKTGITLTGPLILKNKVPFSLPPRVKVPKGNDPLPAVPITRGQVRPAGVADLLVVRQQIKAYEGGEVSHIENVLAGEERRRVHRRLERSEETIVREQETTQEDQRELATAERFEMQREASKTIEQEASLKAGATVSGSYGPSVEFTASFEVAASTAATETSRVASTYAKDVTDRSLKRVVQRVREERTQRILRETEEKNLHALKNSTAKPFTGVYQWVDKLYEAQIYNYGKRLLFDFMIPEPGIFVIHALSSKINSPDLPDPPEPFTIRPEQLSAWNYGKYVSKYGAAGVKAPPSPYTTVAKTFEERSGEGGEARLTKAAELQIPDGYAATSATARWTASHWPSYWFDVFVGDKKFQSGTVLLGNLRGTIPVGTQSGGVNAYTLTIQVNCARTEEAYAQWKLQTYDAIHDAYASRVRDFEAKMSALKAELEPAIQGRNPAENRRIEREQLKRASVELLTEQRFDLFNATRSPPDSYPYFDYVQARAEGTYVKFFEQAFEWEQMTYVFYPYFWGRKENWIERFLIEDVDAQFAEFLRAGSARAVVPVRPGFERAVMHFLETGKTWNGMDQPPDVTDPLYVSLVEEVRDKTGAFKNEVAVGDPWDVRVPTPLVYVRADGSLPSWVKQADESWKPI